jgi:hypothetical protein
MIGANIAALEGRPFRLFFTNPEENKDMFQHSVMRFPAATLPRFIVLACSVALFLSGEVSAVPLDPNISITATVDLDGLSSSAPAGSTQTGTFSQVIGGSLTTSTVDGGLNLTGTLPLGGALTDINDSVGISFTGTGNSAGGSGSSDFFGNYGVTLSNASATDTFQITLGLQFTNQVDANGDDVGIEGDIFLNDGVTEIFFSDLISDTFFGDSAGGSNDGTTVDTPFGPLGTFGASLSDSGTVLLDFLLSPGAIINLTGENNMFLALFDGTYSATVESRLFVSSVVNQTTPPAVPEPATFWLIGAGLMGLRATRRSIKAD